MRQGLKRPVRAEGVVKKAMKVVEIDLDDSEDEKGGVEREWGTFPGAHEDPRTGSIMVEKGRSLKQCARKTRLRPRRPAATSRA